MIEKLFSACVVLVVLIAGCASAPSVGSDAPDFTATDSTGATVNLAAYEEKVLILDFWAVW